MPRPGSLVIWLLVGALGVAGAKAIAMDRVTGRMFATRSEVIARARDGRHQPAAGHAGGARDHARAAATRSTPRSPPTRCSA